MTSPRPTGSGVWATRRARALRLATEAAHAAEMLGTYAELTKVQEAVAGRTPVDRWLALADSGKGSEVRLLVDRLPVEELAPLFADYLLSASHLGTDVMRRQAQELATSLAAGAGPPQDATDSPLAAALLPVVHSGGEPPFHVRAFLQPVMTALATPPRATVQGAASRRCPTCGATPVVGALRDLPDAAGSRSLFCDVCDTSWRTSRLMCVRCGESDPSALAVHQPASLPHVRVDECTSCRHYIKTVDLRRRGDAVPIVEDLATTELDLWARDNGMAKVRANLFGL